MAILIRSLFCFIVSVLLFGLLIASCSNATNYKEAYKVEIDGIKYLKFFGERKYMGHDPSSVSSQDTYKDSILIQVSSFDDGVIKGKSIAVEEGKYNYAGDITIKGKSVKVNLQINDTGDKELRPLSWNGEYILQ